MKLAGCCALVLAAFAASGEQPTTAARLPRVRVLSASRQFVVFADDSITASRLCARAEQLRRVWLDRLQLPPRWRDPIAIVVADENSVGVLPGAGHLKYEVRCTANVSEERLGALIVEVLCRELANRELVVTPEGGRTAQLPLWLPVGLRELLEGETEELLPVIQRSVTGGRPPALEQVQAVASWPTNRVDELQFRAHAWLLVESLFTLPGATTKLQKLMTTAGAQEPSWTFGVVYSGDFTDQHGREKWWSLQLARKLVANVAEALSVSETLAELDEVLRTQLTQAKGPPRTVPIADLWRHSKEPWFPALVREKLNQLQLLLPRAHPFYEETLSTYAAAFLALQREQGFRFRSYLRRAQELRRAADNRRRETDQYVTRVEREKKYADADRWWRRPENLTPPRMRDEKQRDPLRDYLDQFDK